MEIILRSRKVRTGGCGRGKDVCKLVREGKLLPNHVEGNQFAKPLGASLGGVDRRRSYLT